MTSPNNNGTLSAWEMLEIAVSGANGSEEVDLVSLARDAAAEARAMADDLRQGRSALGPTNQDAPVAWMVDRYWHDGSWLDTELHFRKPEPHPDIRTRTKFTALYSSDQFDRMRERVARLRNKVPARRLNDADLVDEDFAVDAVIDAGFGEGGGSPGEWWYERADEIAHEIKRRELERQLAQHNSKPALTKLQDTSHD